MNPIITIDNSALRKQVQNLFEEGTYKFKKGKNLEEKEEGITTQLKGMKILQNWIDRETDQDLKQTLKNTYQQKYKEIEDCFKFLEENKKKAQVVENNEGGAMMKKNGAGGGTDKNDENAKFKESLKEAIITDKPNVKWTDIAGLEMAKKSLQEAVILPIKYPEIFTGARKPWKGILLYGPPGTGKTYLAKACATECDGTFFSISSSDLISKYVGDSEKLIKNLFSMAREKKPAIIFIDEIDSLCGTRNDNENEASRRVKTEFLVQMQGVGHDDTGILVLGATNLPWGLDPAIRRRFEKRIYIPLPDKAAREFLVKHQLKTTPNKMSDAEVEIIAEKTNGYSGADIGILVRDAVFEPVRMLQSAKYFQKIKMNNKEMFTPVDDSKKSMEGVVPMTMMELDNDKLYIPPVVMSDFEISLKRTKASVGQDQLKDYENFTKDFGQDG